ncbi:hypothetical protein Tco_0116136 [Tanacetum coccineum]
MNYHYIKYRQATATYGKVKYCEDEDDCFTNFETKFPAIVLDDTLMSDATLSCEPTVSPLNENEIDFRISFDESDVEDYTPMVSHFDDLDYFKDFEKEFLAIVYNDALTSKLDSLIVLVVSPHHIDELDLKNDTSLSKHDEEEQSVVYFNDLFPLNIIYPDDLKSDKDNDDDEINVIHSSRDMAPLPPRDQRHPWLRYQVERYTEDIVHTFEQRLEMIFGRSVNRVHVLDFLGFTEEMRKTLAGRLRMVYTKDDGQELITSHAWRRLFEIQGPLVREFILELLSTYRMSDSEMGLDVADTLCFQLGGARLREDPVRRLCHRMISCSISGRDQALEKGHFIGRLAAHIGLAQHLCDVWRYMGLGIPRTKEATGCCGWGPEDAEGAHDEVEGDQAVSAPVQAPQPPPPTSDRTIA